MSQKQSLKRKHCSLCATDVDIRVIEPEENVFRRDQHHKEADELVLDYPNGFNLFNLGPEEEAELWESIGEPAEKPRLRISDVIRQLQVVQRREGDLLLCVADVNSLMTLSSDNLDFKVTSKRSYNFAFGLEEENYLSVQMN